MANFLVVLGLIMAASYGIGSLCSAVIVAQLFHLPDPRLQGSRNPGTTNILRIVGKKYAAMVLLADLMKGLLPVLLLKYSQFAPNYLGYVGLFAVLGHIYPVFFEFKGGKGVATALGVMFGLSGYLGLAVVGTWILVAWISRYSSLAGIIALGLAPIYLWFLWPSIQILIPVMAMVGWVLVQHLENMSRLWQGKESKIKF